MVGERQGKGKGMDNYRNKNKSFTYIHAIVTIIIYRYNILALVAFYLSTLFFGVLVSLAKIAHTRPELAQFCLRCGH